MTVDGESGVYRLIDEKKGTIVPSYRGNYLRTINDNVGYSIPAKIFEEGLSNNLKTLILLKDEMILYPNNPSVISTEYKDQVFTYVIKSLCFYGDTIKIIYNENIPNISVELNNERIINISYSLTHAMVNNDEISIENCSVDTIMDLMIYDIAKHCENLKNWDISLKICLGYIWESVAVAVKDFMKKWYKSIKQENDDSREKDTDSQKRIK
jgi:hypothetical protein